MSAREGNCARQQREKGERHPFDAPTVSVFGQASLFLDRVVGKTTTFPYGGRRRGRTAFISFSRSIRHLTFQILTINNVSEKRMFISFGGLAHPIETPRKSPVDSGVPWKFCGLFPHRLKCFILNCICSHSIP